MPSDHEDNYLPARRLKHYELIRLIGRGSRSAVYLARDTSADRRVALKLMNRDPAADASVVWGFFSQATSAAHIQHPLIAQIYFVGQDDSFSFCAREFVEGDSLGSRLAEGQNFSTDELLDSSCQLLEGLAVAHARGIEHGNLHSENVLFDRVQERLVLTDFHGSDQSSTAAPGDGTMNVRRDLRAVGNLVQQMLLGFDATSAFSAKTRTASTADLTKFIERLLGKGTAPPFQSAVEALMSARRLDGSAPPISLADLGAAVVQLGKELSSASTNTTSTVELPAVEKIPELPEDLPATESTSRSRRWWRWFGGRVADDVARRLQDAHTTVAGKLAEMQRRQQWLDRLSEKEQSLLEWLQQQTSGKAAPGAAKGAKQETAIDKQQRQLAQIAQRRTELAGAIQLLETQRDLLDTRLKVLQD